MDVRSSCIDKDIISNESNSGASDDMNPMEGNHCEKVLCNDFIGTLECDSFDSVTNNTSCDKNNNEHQDLKEIHQGCPGPNAEPICEVTEESSDNVINANEENNLNDDKIELKPEPHPNAGTDAQDVIIVVPTTNGQKENYDFTNFDVSDVGAEVTIDDTTNHDHNIVTTEAAPNSNMVTVGEEMKTSIENQSNQQMLEMTGIEHSNEVIALNKNEEADTNQGSSKLVYPLHSTGTSDFQWVSIIIR